jgi:plasmid maintenance system antidote protein VapI
MGAAYVGRKTGSEMTETEFWMNLQKTYELRLAEKAFPMKVRKHIEQHRDALVSAYLS